MMGCYLKSYTINEIANISVGRDLVENSFSKDATLTHRYPVYSNTVENKGLYGFYDFEEYPGNSLTIVGRGAGLGKAFPRSKGFGAIGRLLVLRPIKENFDVRYLSEYINNKLTIYNESGGIPQLPGESLAKYRVELPPLFEQQAIADLLSTWDEAIEKTERLIQTKEKRFKRLLNDLIHQVRNNHTWKGFNLSDLCVPVSRKNSENNTNVLTSSAQYGLVSQPEYYNKSVSAEDVTGYYLLKRGEFAYNRSSAKGYPYGATKRLDRYEKGVLSTLYLCFALKPDAPCESDFLLYIFESGATNREFRAVCQEGARSHGLLNITKGDFFGIKLFLPSQEQQKKIQFALNAAQQEIDLLKQLADKYKTQKRGLMQKMLTGEWRVKPEIVNQYMEV
jgi:type I restriction enzyme S subunit